MKRLLAIFTTWLSSALLAFGAPVPRSLSEKKSKAEKDENDEDEDSEFGAATSEAGAAAQDGDNEPRPVYFFEPADEKKPPRVILRAQSISMDASRPSVLRKLRQQPKSTGFQKQPATIPNK